MIETFPSITHPFDLATRTDSDMLSAHDDSIENANSLLCGEVARALESQERLYLTFLVNDEQTSGPLFYPLLTCKQHGANLVFFFFFLAIG